MKARGYSVLSARGSASVNRLNLTTSHVDVVAMGHGATWEERQELINYVRQLLPRVPILALLRMDDAPFTGATFNLRADDPPQWAATVDMLFSMPN